MPREVIGVKLTADTRQFVRGMHDAVRSFASVEYIAGRASSRFGGVLSKAFNVIGFAAGGALIAGMGGAITSQRMNQYIFRPALEQAKKFNKEFYRTAFLANIDPKGAQAKEFRELAIKAGLSSRFSGAEAMQGIGNLMTGGLTSGEAKAFLPSLLEFTEATFGELDLPQAAKIMAVASKKFDFTGKDPTTVGKEIADTLISVRQASRLEFGEILGMMDSMNNASSLLKTSMQETFALSTALLKEEGMGPRRGGRWASSLGNALTQLRTLLVEIDGLEVKGGKGPRAAAELLGLDPSAFVDESGKIIKGIDTLKVIDKKLQGYGEAEKGSILAQLFTKQESRSLFQTIQKFEMLDQATGKTLKGFEALDYQIKVFNESQGLAAKGAELNRQTLEGQLEILKGVSDTVYQLLGEAYLEGTFPAIKAVKGFLEVITDIGAQHPQLVRVTSILTLLTATALMLGTVVFTGLAASGLLAIFVFGGLLKGGMDLSKSFFSLAVMARRAEQSVEDFSKTAVKSFRKVHSSSKSAFAEAERLVQKFGGGDPNDEKMYFLLQKLSNATGINRKVGADGKAIFPKDAKTFLTTVYEIWGASALFDTLKGPLMKGLSSAYPVLSSLIPMVTSVLLNPVVLVGAIALLTIIASVISAIVFWVGVAALALTNLGLVLGVYLVKKLFESGDAMDNFIKKFSHAELMIKSVYNLLSGKGVSVGDKASLQKVGLWNAVEQGTMILFRFIEAFKTFWKSLDWTPLETALEPLMKAMGFINPEGWARSSVYNWQLIGFRIAQVFNYMIEFAALTIDAIMLIKNEWELFATIIAGLMTPFLMLVSVLFAALMPFVLLFLTLAALGTLFGLAVYGWVVTIVKAVDTLVDSLITLFQWLMKIKQEGPAVIRFAMGDFSAGKEIWDATSMDKFGTGDTSALWKNGTPIQTSPTINPSLSNTIEPGSVRPTGNEPLFRGKPGAYEPVDLNAQKNIHQGYKAQDAATMKSITNHMNVSFNNPTVTDPSDLSKMEELVRRVIGEALSDKRVFGN